GGEAGNRIDLVDIELAGGVIEQKVHARHSFALHRAITLDRQTAHFRHLLFSQIGREHRLRGIEKVLVFVVVKLARRKNLAGNGGNRFVVAHHRAFKFTAHNAALDNDFAVELRREFQRSLQFGAILYFGNTDGRSEIRRLDEEGKWKARATHIRDGLPFRTVNNEVVHYRQAALFRQPLHHFFVHRNR